MAHTPGPWEAKPTYGRIVLNGSSIYGVADITGEFAGWNPDDLLLMAAAPELLAALRLGMEWSEDDGYPDDDDMLSVGERLFRQAARAAINKAEGRSE
jgi:hypothetical protein